MSYSDPKLINDKTVQIVGGMTEMAKQQFAADRQAEQQRVTANISSLVQGGINALTPKAQAMNKLDKSVIKSSQNMYNKIGSSDFDTGLDKWDETLDGFMNGIVDQNNLTIQAMNNGSMIDLSKGQRDIAMYENIVDIYEEAVPNIKAASNVINRSANATDIGEKLSLTGPPPYQLDIIRKMNTDEAGDLQIIQEGNNIIIRDPNATYIDPKTGKEVKGTELNINQFNKAITDKENPYFKYAVDTKPDTERNFNQKIKSGKDGAFNPLYVTIDEEAKDSNGQTVTTYNMTPEQQEKFKKDVMGDKGNGYANGGQFAGLIEEFGESIWEDQMQGGDNNTQYPEEVPKMPTGSREAIVKSGDKEALKLYDEQAEEYGTYYNDYYKPMLDALANQSLNNAASNGIVLDKPKEEPADEETEEVTETEEVSETPETTEEDEVVVKNFYEANTDIEKPVYKNDKGEDISFEDDSAAFLTDIETTYGGYDGDEGTTGIPSYGDEDDTRVYDHLNSTKVLPGKSGKYFDGTPKKGLKADIGEDVYNALSDAEKAMLRMEHLNVGWNPKVLMLQTAGIISKDDRGKYHKPQNQKDPSKWDVNKLYEENKDKIADLLKGKDNVMVENLEAIYKGTDNSKPKNTSEKNTKRNKGYQAQYTKRIADIKDRYKIQDVVEEEETNEQLAEQFED